MYSRHKEYVYQVRLIQPLGILGFDNIHICKGMQVLGHMIDSFHIKYVSPKHIAVDGLFGRFWHIHEGPSKTRDVGLYGQGYGKDSGRKPRQKRIVLLEGVSYYSFNNLREEFREATRSLSGIYIPNEFQSLANQV